MHKLVKFLPPDEKRCLEIRFKKYARNCAHNPSFIMLPKESVLDKERLNREGKLLDILPCVKTTEGAFVKWRYPYELSTRKDEMGPQILLGKLVSLANASLETLIGNHEGRYLFSDEPRIEVA